MTNKTVSNNKRQIESNKKNHFNEPSTSASADNGNLHSISKKSSIKPQKNCLRSTERYACHKWMSLLEVQTKQRGELIDICNAIYSEKRKKIIEDTSG